MAQWGYASQGRYNFSLPAAAVREWHRPPAGGKAPGFAFVDGDARDDLAARDALARVFTTLEPPIAPDRELSAARLDREGRLVVGTAPRAPRARACLLYTSPSPRDGLLSRMPASA